jgi:hypothetical protein
MTFIVRLMLFRVRSLALPTPSVLLESDPEVADGKLKNHKSFFDHHQ